jgi:hypothetical protein
MKRTSAAVVLTLLACSAVFFLWGRHLTGEIAALRNQVLTEELSRSHADEQLLASLGQAMGDLMSQVGSVEEKLEKLARVRDMKSLLPDEYVREVPAYIRNEIELLVNQEPVFGTAWEVLSVQFFSPNLVAVGCRDGEIAGTLLVLIYPAQSGGYSAEVLYSNVKLWAG